jgi:hypothetical protein
MAPPQQTDLRRRKAVADAIAGLGASLVALWTFYPLDVIKTNHQAGIAFSDSDLYRGVGAKTLHSASSSFLYFYLYSWITTWWTDRTKGSKISTLARLSLSAVAAMLNTAVTLPLDVVSSQQQTSFSNGDSGRSQSRYLKQELSAVEEEAGEEEDDGNAFFDPEEDFLEEEKKDDDEVTDLTLPNSPISSITNITSLWKGLAPSLLLCSNPSIHYTVFDLLKANLLEGRSQQKLSLSESFAMGLIAKLTATLATYPLIRAKILLMVTHRKSLLGCLIREYKRGGVRGLYRGCNLQLAHTILKSALLMMVRERITSTTYRLLLSQ